MPDPVWRDHEIALPATDGPRRLRFATEFDGTGREALWGSILLLGDGDPGVPRPNLLLVSLDTLGADYLGTFSNRSDVSPHLDAFFAQGASFRRAYAQYGSTLTSHASLFSALQPRRHGVLGSSFALTSSLVENLAVDGYRTTAFTEGGFVGAGFGFGLGFDAFDDGTLDLAGTADAGAAETFERAAAWLESHSRERFFAFLHSYGVRWPGVVPNVAVEGPVQLVDVIPTVFELIGLSVPKGLDGRSLVPLLRDPAAPSRPAFSEQHQDPIDCLRLRIPQERCQEVDRVAVQTERFKLVSSRFPPYSRLYDLASDPQEQRVRPPIGPQWSGS